MSRPEAGMISVVIPARNEAARIGALVRAVAAQDTLGRRLETIVVDDASSDDTVAVARGAGARVLSLQAGAESGNPAIARNRGAASAQGDPIIFLDADCIPAAGWLPRLLAAHERGADVVGGSLDLPLGLTASGALRLLLRLVSRALPPAARGRHQPSAGKPERAPEGVRRHRRIHRAAADRLRARGAGVAGGRAARGRPHRVRAGGRRLSPQSSRVRATCSGGTTAGGSAPSRARRRRAPRGRPGSTGIPDCWCWGASPSRSAPRLTSSAAGPARGCSSPS